MKKMRVHILQHVPFEDIGSICQWLTKAGADISYTRFFDDQALPQIQGLDLVIAMGGPMSVNDESVLPWLRAEKDFIRQAVHNGVSVLGICLGAQLIASALGARVYRNPQKEIGWFPIEATGRLPETFCFPKKCTVFHWHGETFDLPAGAVHLAKSQGCANQAFQIGRNVIGMQFHLESTPESVGAILDNCSNELTQGRYIQTADELRKAAASSYIKINSIMDDVLSFITKTSGHGGN